MPGKCYVISLWHSLGLPYNYFTHLIPEDQWPRNAHLITGPRICLNDFILTSGQGQTIPRVQKFDVNRNPLPGCQLAAILKNKLALSIVQVCSMVFTCIVVNLLCRQHM